jgi:hypothetical protein
MPEDKTANMIERALATFQSKGPAIKKLENRRGTDENPVPSDLMEREFRPYVYHGNRDPNSGAELVGAEADFYEKAKEARDNRLVGMADGRVVFAAGSLGDGTAMLYDSHGRPVLRNGQEPPVQQTKRRSNKEW